MAQIDDLNQAQAALQAAIATLTTNVDDLAQSATLVGQRIAALPAGPNLQPNIDLANAQAQEVNAQAARVVSIKQQLDTFAP